MRFHSRNFPSFSYTRVSCGGSKTRPNDLALTTDMAMCCDENNVAGSARFFAAACPLWQPNFRRRIERIHLASLAIALVP